MSQRIEGYILAQSPIHQTQPLVEGFVDWRPEDSAPRLVFSDRSRGRCQVMMNESLFTPEGRRISSPIIAGNSLRGVLRRAATRALLTAIGQPVRPELFQVLSAGAFHRKDMGGIKSADMLNGAAKNVFVGLFGGGGASFPSGYTATDMRPVSGNTAHLLPAWVVDEAGVAKGTRTDEGTGEVKTFDQSFLRIYATIRRDPMMQGEGVSFVHQHDQVYAERMKEMVATKAKTKAKKAAAGDDDTQVDSIINLAMMSYVQAIVPGVPLSFSLQFRRWTTDEQIGLALIALEDMVNAQALGGASRRGFGRFKPVLKLWVDSQEQAVPVFNAVEVSGSVDHYELSDVARGYADAARAAMEQVTIAELEDLFITTEAKSAAAEAA